MELSLRESPRAALSLRAELFHLLLAARDVFACVLLVPGGEAGGERRPDDARPLVVAVERPVRSVSSWPSTSPPLPLPSPPPPPFSSEDSSCSDAACAWRAALTPDLCTAAEPMAVMSATTRRGRSLHKLSSTSNRMTPILVLREALMTSAFLLSPVNSDISPTRLPCCSVATRLPSISTAHAPSSTSPTHVACSPACMISS